MAVGELRPRGFPAEMIERYSAPRAAAASLALARKWTLVFAGPETCQKMTFFRVWSIFSISGSMS